MHNTHSSVVRTSKAFETQASQEAVQHLQGDDNADDAFMPPQGSDKEETVCL